MNNNDNQCCSLSLFLLFSSSAFVFLHSFLFFISFFFSFFLYFVFYSAGLRVIFTIIFTITHSPSMGRKDLNRFLILRTPLFFLLIFIALWYVRFFLHICFLFYGTYIFSVLYSLLLLSNVRVFQIKKSWFCFIDRCTLK